MSTTNITVTPDVLKQTAEGLSGLSNELKNCFDRITACIEVIKENWTDENGRRFSERYEGEVKPKLSAYYNSIMQHSKYVGEASRIYQETIGSIHATVN